MKLKAFNKQLKKEFNENYNGKALVEIKEKKNIKTPVLKLFLFYHTI